MAVDFSQFTVKTSALTTDYLVGYDQNESGGEKKFTLSTIANAVSGIIAPSFAQTPAFTGTFKNKLINGNFDIWQRGTSLTSGTGGRYLADRFTNGSAGTTCTAAQSTFALGQTNVPNEPKYYISTVVTSVVGASNNATLHQHIEGVRSCAGKTVTLSFYAKANASKNIAVELYQNFGTGGTPSTSVSVPAGLKALTTSWQKFTVTANIPSIASGTNLGTAGNDSLVVYFWFDAGSSNNSRASSLGQQSGTFDIAQVQIEEGSVATPFENRPIGTELALCQRYYEKSYDLNTDPGTITPVGLVLSSLVKSVGPVSNGIGTVSFKNTKRSSPTIKIYSNLTGAINKFVNYQESGNPDRDASAQTVGLGGFYTQYDGVASLTNPLAIYQWTAESEL
jgi:hypothetical protein